MLHLDDVLLTEAVKLPGMSLSDLEQEIEQMFLRNKAIQAFYQHLKLGTLNKGFIEEFADTLAECDVDPYVWLDHSQSNVGLVLGTDTDYEI